MRGVNVGLAPASLLSVQAEKKGGAKSVEDRLRESGGRGDAV
jgi:hypothetical protein